MRKIGKKTGIEKRIQIIRLGNISVGIETGDRLGISGWIIFKW